MKSALILISALFIFLLTQSLSSQQDYVQNNKIDFFEEHFQDYKIISSNSSYLEIEFYPAYGQMGTVNCINNQCLSVINFSNYIEKGLESVGLPNLRYRAFPVIFPSEQNNSVTVVDYDVSEIKNIDLAPIPGVRMFDPYKRNFENFEITYDKNIDAYSKNTFLPEKLASLENIGLVRELTMGNLVIHPYQYNPVTRVLKQYTRIRARIAFGQSPVSLNRVRSPQEYSLLKDIAINTDVGINWMNPGLLKIPRKFSLTDSRLSQGDWYKIEVKDNGDGKSEGIYKITKSFLESAGINLTNVDARTIKLFGNGGNSLPEGINDPRPEDLVEIAVYFEGENDGHFDPQDFILFYGRSVNNWNYDTTGLSYSHFVSVYSTSNYYWICLNTPGNGKRMQSEPSENVQNPYVPASFKEKIFYEPEINNLISEGNVWLSERKSSGQSIQWNNTLTGLTANSDILYKIKLASHVAPPISNYFLISEVNSTMSEIYFPLGNYDPAFGRWISTEQTSFILNASQKSPPNSEQSTFKATFQTPSPEGEGYLDWMEIQYDRQFNSVTNDFVRFNSPDTNITVEYNISSFSGNPIRIFDINSHSDAAMIQPLLQTSNSVKFQKSWVQRDSSLHGHVNKFIVTGPNGYKTPTSISQRIPNQNLRGFSEGADFIIITDGIMLPAASRLKEKRERVGPSNPDYLKTIIVTTDQIYNEFSGGVLDAVSIRDFLKYAYFNWNRRPVYVLFLGDGDFDYKHILGNNTNFVPAWEHSDPEIHQVNGYVTDDFYTQIIGNDTAPDLAQGRITAINLDEAMGYLDKEDCYEDPSYNGYWKNRGIYVADDGIPNGEGPTHTDDVESLAEDHIPDIFEKTKIYLVSYPTVITSQGRRKPGVNSDIVKYWNAGSFMLHYAGHGAPDVWAHEYVFEKEVTISQLSNRCKYNFVSVASCDFSKWDNPLSRSGGEMIVMAPNKGAIGSLAAARPTYSTGNRYLTNAFYQALVYNRDTLRLQVRFGNALFSAKQVYHSENDMKYIIICDPTLRIQIPRFSSVIDSISGLKQDTMRALSRIKIYGSVIHPDSSLWSDYNGKIFLKIFDVPRTDSLFDGQVSQPYVFKVNGGIIFSGTQTVRNGKWSVEYIVPKDLSYLNKNGKLIDYFYNSQADGHGLDTNFIIGGIDPNAPADSVGPDIKLFLNNRNFRSGDMVNENFKLIADLFDESGINTTGTIGHKIEATLDDDINHKYDLTTFYNSDTTYKSGSLEYDFTSVPDGEHRLTLKAWDTYNNSSEAQIKFTVSSYNGLKVVDLYNYPNPFKNNTTFTFQHNYPDEISVSIKIYTVAGRLIKQIKRDHISDKFVAIDWSGKDEDGETLANGIYIYTLIVNTGDGKSVSNTGKLAVLK